MNKILACMAILFAFGNAQAKVRMASLFNDGMILQQQSDVKVWGWAKPNSKVTLTGTWNKKKVTCQSGNDGKWEARMQTPAASFTPYELTVSDGEKLTIKNILIGEVWLGSGQSNMEMPLVGYNSCPIEGLNEVINDCHRYKGKIHFVTTGHQAPLTPVDSVKAEWKECTPENIWNCSATCYFFAKTLVDALDCPVGVISSSWGGTSVEGWTPADILKDYDDVDLSEENLKKNAWNTPMVRYNGKIHPLVGYTLKGFLWYQGEANRDWPDKYAARLGNMVKAWRKLWGQGDLPFYEVEIAPYGYDGTDKTSAALLREAQHDFTKQVANTGMVSTNDLVNNDEMWQIHPCKKREVGQRLCYLALSKTYGKKGYMAESPEYDKMEIKDGKAYLSFTHCEYGYNRNFDIRGFEICGADKVFHTANAAIENNRVIVSSPDVKEPVAVRYCFRNWLPGNLGNVGGMPIIPFRTDRN